MLTVSSPSAIGAAVVKDFEGVARRAKRKLEALHAAARLEDLRVPRCDRLEKLKGDRKAFHSIRINDQWRIVFRWMDGHAHDVAIVDYH
jgi:toxin HigB-1